MGVVKPPTVVQATIEAFPLKPKLTPATMTAEVITPTYALTKPPKHAVQLAIARTVACQLCTPAGPQGNSNLKTIARGVAWEDQDITTLARIMLPSRGAMLQADMDGTATCKGFDLTSDTPDTAIITTSSIAAASIISDTLQVDSYWNTDNVGYNFKHTQAITAGKLEGGKVYRFEYSFDTDNDGLVYVIAEVAVQGLYST